MPPTSTPTAVIVKQAGERGVGERQRRVVQRHETDDQELAEPAADHRQHEKEHEIEQDRRRQQQRPAVGRRFGRARRCAASARATARSTGGSRCSSEDQRRGEAERRGAQECAAPAHQSCMNSSVTGAIAEPIMPAQV